MMNLTSEMDQSASLE
ncbi:hypothetical protein F383_24819 [Gossypium arboreum]|nr:hypothetical protein F383_24819 [Gossypium arboreum]